MFSFKAYEVRIEMKDGSIPFSQVFIGKPTSDEVIEVVETIGRDERWVQVLKADGLPVFHWRDHNTGADGEIGFYRHLGILIATIHVVPIAPIPVGKSGIDELFSESFLAYMKSPQ